MNPYQIIAIISTCSIVSGLLIAGLTVLGGSLLTALGAVYIATLWMMLGMQRRARESSELQHQQITRRASTQGARILRDTTAATASASRGSD